MPSLTTAFPSCFIALIPAYRGMLRNRCTIPIAEVGFNWLLPSYLHVTLYYLGWLSAQDAGSVNRILDRKRPCPVDRIQLNGTLDVVGEPDQRSLVAPLAADTQLADWREALAAALQAQGFSCEQPFHPHVTIARVSPGPLARAQVKAMRIDRLVMPAPTVGLFSGRTGFSPVSADGSAPNRRDEHHKE